MIERTWRKLDEARFFYQLLINERPQTMKAFGHDPGAFRYYFSAFIQAARSVTWTLGNEEPGTWKAWERAWRDRRSTEEKRLLDLTNELRLDEAKRGGANALVEWEEVALHELLAVTDFDLERQHPAYGTHVFVPPGVDAAKPVLHTHHSGNGVENEGGAPLAKRYLDFLDKMLNDFCTDNQRASPR